MPHDASLFPTSPRASAHQILLIEDEKETATLIKQLLEAHGYRVMVAKDGGQAQITFSMHKPDFVILDLILPGESGFEICERLKQIDKTVPIMILSEIEMPESRELARRVGADRYLTKPFEPSRLFAEIEEVAEEVWARHHAPATESAERVRFSCRCGKRFKVSAAHRGKSLTCPECGEPVIVPRHD